MKFPIFELNQYFGSIKIIQGIFSVFGDFGVGKTTFALQTAINSAKLEKSVIFVYTKPNFPLEKIQLIIGDSEEMLENILFVQTIKFNELYKIIFNLEFLVLNFLKENRQKLDLIIIDSITNLYRIELNMKKKEKNYNLNYQLNQILANLSYLNETYGIEILIVNEISKKNLNNQIIETQSGGKVMEFWVKYNLKITRSNKLNERKLVFTNISENKTNEYTLNLKEKGFE